MASPASNSCRECTSGSLWPTPGAITDSSVSWLKVSHFLGRWLGQQWAWGLGGAEVSVGGIQEECVASWLTLALGLKLTVVGPVATAPSFLFLWTWSHGSGKAP